MQVGVPSLLDAAWQSSCGERPSAAEVLAKLKAEHSHCVWLLTQMPSEGQGLHQTLDSPHSSIGSDVHEHAAELTAAFLSAQICVALQVAHDAAASQSACGEGSSSTFELLGSVSAAQSLHGVEEFKQS